ncbi:MAG: DUF354 domain-containing protein [Bacteroidales bacterium]|nr:DUF354 domain-containing protein [Bacteroidales bacterium]
MRVLIDIGHPAHVHLFKNFAFELIKLGNEILFTCREKEFENELLTNFGFRFVSFGNKHTTLKGKILDLFRFGFKEYLIGKKFRPDIILSHGSIYAAITGFLINKPHISLEDSGNMEQILLYRLFTKAIVTPDVLKEKLGKKQIRYKSYHELAYLHPNYFSPDSSIYNILRIREEEKYCILRFVSWNATHDEGQKGFSYEEKKVLIRLLSDKMRVFITSESKLSDDLKQYQILIPPERIHDALYYASIVISEGATIASESGVLGTTTFYVSSIRRSYCEDQERFGLVYNFQESKAALVKIIEILNDNNSLSKQSEARKELITEKIDVTAFLIWFVKNWPESIRIMKENPEYQERFK